MKFRYQYRTKDNEVRSGEIAAADRDAVYAALKAQGIRPSRVDEAPGVFNRLFGKGKRWLAIIALGIIAAVAAGSWLVAEREVEAATKIDEAVPRHQIYGDPAVVAKFAHYDGLKAVLGNAGDALLACFAQPGKLAELGSARNDSSLLAQSFAASQPMVASDSREVRELKQMVNWMRRELVAYVDNTDDARSREQKLRAYYFLMTRRVAEEQRVYKLVEIELKNCIDEDLRETKNAKLRKLGLPSIVSPDL